MIDEGLKHLIKHNILGLMQAGMEAEDAVDMAMTMNEPLFSKKLMIKRSGTVTSSGGSSGGGSSHGGGSYGGITGG